MRTLSCDKLQTLVSHYVSNCRRRRWWEWISILCRVCSADVCGRRWYFRQKRKCSHLHISHLHRLTNYELLRCHVTAELMSVNTWCITTVILIKKATVSMSQNVKDSSHGNKYLRKIKINLSTKVEICISTYSNANVICYSATCQTELNKGNSVPQIVDRTHIHPFNGPVSGTTRVSRYQKGKTNLDFTEVRDSEW